MVEYHPIDWWATKKLIASEAASGPPAKSLEASQFKATATKSMNKSVLFDQYRSSLLSVALIIFRRRISTREASSKLI